MGVNESYRLDYYVILFYLRQHFSGVSPSYKQSESSSVSNSPSAVPEMKDEVSQETDMSMFYFHWNTEDLIQVGGKGAIRIITSHTFFEVGPHSPPPPPLLCDVTPLKIKKRYVVPTNMYISNIMNNNISNAYVDFKFSLKFKFSTQKEWQR